MNEKEREEDFRKTEVRCDVCRKTFAASEADTRCPECKIGRVRIMEKAAQIALQISCQSCGPLQADVKKCVKPEKRVGPLRVGVPMLWNLGFIAAFGEPITKKGPYDVETTKNPCTMLPMG